MAWDTPATGWARPGWRGRMLAHMALERPSELLDLRW